MKVAIPWNLSTYIPLNSFHPLYKALVHYAPDNIEFNVWDTAKLYTEMRDNEDKRREVASSILKYRNVHIGTDWITQQLQSELSLPDTCFSRWLPGDIEFLHTAPFPSMTRPFVFHCEAFLPIFFPFSHQGDGKFEHYTELREYYKAIFENPLCLGIFSHIPETLDEFKVFFNSDVIASKLYSSRIGVVSQSQKSLNHNEKDELTFLFINSAHQSKESFIKRGGHIVIKFWEKFIAEGKKGRLIIRCARPDNVTLREVGVNIDFIESQIGKTITWAEDFLPINELDKLVSFADFLLLPSASLHSVSILSAMNQSTIPVVTDTIGPENYVKDGQNGIVLSGVYNRIWSRDSGSGIIIDHYENYDDNLIEDLVAQLINRILNLLDNPEEIKSMQRKNKDLSNGIFNPAKFADEFWSKIETLYLEFNDSSKNIITEHIRDMPFKNPEVYLLSIDEVQNNFDSTTQPVARFIGGHCSIFEYCGNYICFYGYPVFQNKLWSLFEQFVNDKAPIIIISRELFNLERFILPVSQTSIESGMLSPLLVRKIADKIRDNPVVFFPVRFLYRVLHVLEIRINGYIKYRRCLSNNKDLEMNLFMVAEGINGYNIVRFFGKYYAVKQSIGAFSIEDYKKGRYGHIYSSYSIDKVLKKVRKVSLSNTVKNKIATFLNDYPKIKKNVRNFYLFFFKR